jgi:hypothetical protein
MKLWFMFDVNGVGILRQNRWYVCSSINVLGNRDYY